MKKYKGLVFAIIFVAAVLGVFYFIYQKNQPSVENQANLTEVQKLINKDISKNYPQTPREVVKLYNRFVDCYYKMEYTDEELDALASNAEVLFDKDLLSVNPHEDYVKLIKEDAKLYAEKSISIVQLNVCDSNDVEYLTAEGKEIAYVETSYFIKQKESYVKTYQTYVLRKDDKDNWKILVFYKSETPNSESD